MACSAGVRFPGEFASVLVVKTWDGFDLSGSLCRRGGSSGLVTVLRGNPVDARSAAIAVESRWKPNSRSGLNCGHCAKWTYRSASDGNGSGAGLQRELGKLAFCH